MFDPHVLNVVIHVSAGIAALLLGVVPLVTRKGGLTHRRVGRVFVWVAIPVLGAAIIADVFNDPPPALVGATVAATYGYLSSLRALKLRDSGPGVLDGVLAGGALVACVFLFVFMGPGTASWSPSIGYSTIGYVGTLAIYDLSRYGWSNWWQAHARPLDHGLKMTGAYFAMMSAGFGNLFPAVQPFSQFGPSMLGLLVMAVLAAIWVTRARRKTAQRLPLPRSERVA